MSRIYTSTNKIKFTDIPEKYAVPRQFKAKLSSVHSEVVIYVVDHFSNTKKYRQKVTDALNYLTYCVINSENPDFSWSKSSPIDTMPSDIDFNAVEEYTGALFLTEDAIQWDVSPSDHFRSLDEGKESNNSPVSDQPIKSTKSETNASKYESNMKKISNPVSSSTVINKPLKAVREAQGKASGNKPVAKSLQPTPKEDLYIQPPKYPRFDTSKVWLKQVSGDDMLVIYTTLPEIPTRQNEISVTTNIDAMTDSELMNLYPNQFIRTRSAKMYEKVDGLSYDDELGVIIPIEGFSEEQVIDNIIQYPHLYKLRKIDQTGNTSNFYRSLEIDGELYPVEEIWDNLPESVDMPRDPEFVKEYVVRRYLLEESVGKEHKFKLSGSLDPFLTVFMPPKDYVKRGYKDTLSIVKQCVRSRVRYKQSRNPILRRLGQNA